MRVELEDTKSERLYIDVFFGISLFIYSPPPHVHYTNTSLLCKATTDKQSPHGKLLFFKSREGDVFETGSAC